LLKLVDERNEVVEWLDYHRQLDREEDMLLSKSITEFTQSNSIPDESISSSSKAKSKDKKSKDKDKSKDEKKKSGKLKIGLFKKAKNQNLTHLPILESNHECNLFLNEHPKTLKQYIPFYIPLNP